MQSGAAQKDGRGYAAGHAGMVQLREAKGRLAQLAVLLLGVGQPLHQALLVDVLDTTTALARVKQRLVNCALPAAYTASVCFVSVTHVRGCGVRVVEGVVLSTGRRVVCLVEEPRIGRPCVGGHYAGRRVLACGDCVR
jgi:hypothetical protein